MAHTFTQTGTKPSLHDSLRSIRDLLKDMEDVEAKFNLNKIKTNRNAARTSLYIAALNLSVCFWGFSVDTTTASLLVNWVAIVFSLSFSKWLYSGANKTESQMTWDKLSKVHDEEEYE